MKRSLLIAAAAATAVALLTGCSATTEAPSDDSASTSPTATASPSASGQPDSEAPQPPEGADAALIAFVDVLKKSCDAATTQGAVSKSGGTTTINVPESKAIDKIANVDIVQIAEGEVANYLPPMDARTGKPMPFICSIYSSAYVDLMDDGKSTKFSETAEAWAWKDEIIEVTIAKGADLVAKYTMVYKGGEQDFTSDVTMTYGVSDADYEKFKNAVANPTEPTQPNQG